MKKIFSLLLLLLLMVIPNVQAENLPEPGKDVVKIYMFRGDGCGGCEYAIEEFNNFAGKYDEYFELVTFETWYNQNNAGLMQIYIDKYDAESAVPFFVIGDEYHQVGYSEDVITAALDAYEDEEYKDIVADELNGKEHLYEALNLEESVEAEGMTFIGTSSETVSDPDYDAFVVVGIIVVVIGGLSFLIFAPNKKK